MWDPDAKLSDFRARWYDPEIGRFVSEDPIGLAGGINLYRFVGNNPVSGWDPFGLDFHEGPCNPDPCELDPIGVTGFPLPNPLWDPFFADPDDPTGSPIPGKRRGTPGPSPAPGCPPACNPSAGDNQLPPQPDTSLQCGLGVVATASIIPWGSTGLGLAVGISADVTALGATVGSIAMSDVSKGKNTLLWLSLLIDIPLAIGSNFPIPIGPVATLGEVWLTSKQSMLISGQPWPTDGLC